MLKEKDDIIELVEKLKDDIHPREFVRYFTEYYMNNIDKADELMEANKEMFELFPQVAEGKMSFKELLLLISPTLKEAMRYVYKRLLAEQ